LYRKIAGYATEPLSNVATTRTQPVEPFTVCQSNSYSPFPKFCKPEPPAAEIVVSVEGCTAGPPGHITGIVPRFTQGAVQLPATGLGLEQNVRLVLGTLGAVNFSQIKGTALPALMTLM
jgi:hypothetical protein